MQFDTTIKELLKAQPPRLLAMLVGAQISEMLTVEFPSVKMRRPDFVARLTDGRILHLEIQSEGEDMPWRMLEYYLLIRRAYGQPPTQIVLYIGEKPAKIASSIVEERLRFSCDVIDIREIDGQPLIESDSLADNLFAILCKVDDLIEVSHRIIEKIATLPGKAARNELAKLLVLSKLRGLQKIVVEEVKKAMELSVEDLMDIPFVEEAFLKGEKEGEEKGKEKGKKEGMEEMLSRMLEVRFGPLPEWAKAKIASAEIGTLENWGLRLLNASSLEEALAETIN